MAYSDKVLDHYENPRNVGTFDDGDQVGTGMVGAPAVSYTHLPLPTICSV